MFWTSQPGSSVHHRTGVALEFLIARQPLAREFAFDRIAAHVVGRPQEVCRAQPLGALQRDADGRPRDGPAHQCRIPLVQPGDVLDDLREARPAPDHRPLAGQVADVLNARRRERHPVASAEGRVFHIQWREKAAVSEVILHRPAVAVGLDPELAVALVPPAGRNPSDTALRPTRRRGAGPTPGAPRPSAASGSNRRQRRHGGAPSPRAGEWTARSRRHRASSGTAAIPERM